MGGGISSTQSALILKAINSNRFYYIFTVDQIQNYPYGQGLRYSKIDLELDNGLGGIVSDEKNIVLNKHCYEKLTAIYNAENNEYWIASVKIDSDEILAYNVIEAGVNHLPVVSHMSEENSSVLFYGYMKFSPDGNKMAIALWKKGTKLFDFDKNTGIFSNEINFDSFLNEHGSQSTNYGISFSPNSQLLYVSYWNIPNKISQYNVSLESEAVIKNSRIDLGGNLENENYFKALQIGPDSKIYIAEFGNYLSVLHNPNEIGEEANLELNYLNLETNFSKAGLPTFVSSFFEEQKFQFDFENVCFGNPTHFYLNEENISDVFWDFGDGNVSSNQNPIHNYVDFGEFEVILTFEKDGRKYEIRNTILVLESPFLEIKNMELEVCENEIKQLNLKDFILEKYPEFIDFELTFYNSNDNAIEKQYQIEKNQELEIGKQFFIRIENLETNCFEVLSLNIVKQKRNCDLEIPEGFSPNGDGINDLFLIKNLAVNFPNYKIQFYNRWGKLVYTDEKGKHWNGQLNRNKQRVPTGVYFYVVNFNDSKTQAIQGKLYLSR
ncbi:T9SS type B sorting domain-containing protein [Aureivirga marina]|uniref:T9SS type B sorting domain-containing protein n=1 Tax=Aureivirga marina TaxID=1182451 RepID=UPI0018C9A116|nr:gliding motility-associated C-terminal domain-containing protein [Aureivirga marina]